MKGEFAVPEIAIKSKDFIKDMLKKRKVMIALAIVFSISYYINPLDNVDITDWNRTFCSAIMSGISINSRIGNFYKLFFLYLPLILTVVLALLTFICKVRPIYEDYFSRICIFLFFLTISSYVSKYSSDINRINDNPMLQCMLAFLIVLSIVAVLDKKQLYSFKDIVLLFLFFLYCVITFSMLVHVERITWYIVIATGIVIFMVIGNVYTRIGEKAGLITRKYMYTLLWLPSVIRGLLEGIYFLTEKGKRIERYFTHISRATILVVILLGIFVFAFRKKDWKYDLFGYVGAIVSASTVSYFQYDYQYVFSYGSMANVYELGNCAVAMDTYLYGKLPIVDYFSAHALADVWTKLVYCFVHGDINGILVNPYAGLSAVASFIILYYIVRQLVGEENAILFVILFPGLLTGIKWSSICYISIAMLFYICQHPSKKRYIIFWISVLFGAFMLYDEGISLGIACILGYCIFCILQKEWKKLKEFGVGGVYVGVFVFVLYIVYSLLTGVPVIERIKEWISLSVGSNTSWATADFGDPTTFAFFVSYFVVPATAIILFVAVQIRYLKTKNNITIAIATVVFSIAEILFISRSMVFHNLATSAGWTGVLLNFIHWTVSVYVLYVVSIREKSENTKLLAFCGTMMAVIIVEGTAVTHYWPGSDSSLMSISLKASKAWDLQDGVETNIDKPRIVYDDNTSEFVSSFTDVFDLLLTEDQTFLDFANVTSLYLMTGRRRPCYVGQSPSLLTNLYSQECFLKEIDKYECPLTVMGTTETEYVQHMWKIPHNIRYYKLAEYIYNNYRPLVNFGEFSIWCEKEQWDDYHSKLYDNGFTEKDYTLVDYGYDFTTSYIDENGESVIEYMPYHSYDLEMIPYIWANNDDYHALENKVLYVINPDQSGKYKFEGSQKYVSDEGNYLSFEACNDTEDNISANIVLNDSDIEHEGAKIRYFFTVKPGTNQYIIRVSQDYFWDVFNINTIFFENNEHVSVKNLKILEGD